MLLLVLAPVLAKVDPPERRCLAVGQGRDLLAIVNHLGGPVRRSTALLG